MGFHCSCTSIYKCQSGGVPENILDGFQHKAGTFSNSLTRMPNNIRITMCFAQSLRTFLYTVAMVGDDPYHSDPQGNEISLSTTIEAERLKVNFAAGVFGAL